MDPVEIVITSIDKYLTDKIEQPKRRGPKGYDLVLKLRLLVYGVLKGLLYTRELVRHLKKYPDVLKRLGFDSIPHRTTIDRWKKTLDKELKELTSLLGDAYLDLKDSEWVIIDSTPIVDEEDEDSKVGYNSKGKFIGFKLHLSCDEYLVPLRAEFTKANVHDVNVAESLLVPVKYGSADSAYDSSDLKLTAWQVHGVMFATGHNPRRLGKDKKRKMEKKFAEMRERIEQLNSIIN